MSNLWQIFKMNLKSAQSIKLDKIQNNQIKSLVEQTYDINSNLDKIYNNSIDVPSNSSQSVKAIRAIVYQYQIKCNESRKQASGWNIISCLISILAFVIFCAGLLLCLFENPELIKIITSAGIPSVVAVLAHVQLKNAKKREDYDYNNFKEASKLLSALEVLETMKDSTEKYKLTLDIIKKWAK